MGGQARRGGPGQVYGGGEGLPGGTDSQRGQEVAEGAANLHPGQAGQLLQGDLYPKLCQQEEERGREGGLRQKEQGVRGLRQEGALQEIENALDISIFYLE